MSDILAQSVTPLGGASYAGLIQVRELPAHGMITIRGDMSSPDLVSSVTTAVASDMPERRQALFSEGRGLFWMSPDELLVLLPYAEAPEAVARMSEMLTGGHNLVVDVSDARVCFELRGAGVREVLAKLTPADMSPEALPPGELRRSRLARAPAAFWLEREGKARVICFRSVAQYMFDLLKRAAQPGSAVGHFAD